jgi:signal transduction histidine kinase
VPRSRSDGRWGLVGMRERADQVGARLTVRSRTGAGTEVELTVPGHVAFRDAAQTRRSRSATLLHLLSRARGDRGLEKDS